MKLKTVLRNIILEYQIKDPFYISAEFVKLFNEIGRKNIKVEDGELFIEAKAKKFIEEIYKKVEKIKPKLYADIIDDNQVEVKGKDLNATIKFNEKNKVLDFKITIEGEEIKKLEKAKFNIEPDKKIKKTDIQKQKDKEKEKLSKHSEKTLIDLDRENISKYIRDTSPELRKKQWNIQIFSKHGYTTAGTGDEAFVKNFLTKVIAFLDLKSMEDDDFSGKGTEQQPLMKGKLKMTTVIYQEKLGAPRKLDPEKTPIYFENTQLNPFFEGK